MPELPLYELKKRDIPAATETVKISYAINFDSGLIK